MAECEMRTVVESVRTMLLHMGVPHHWWHLALRQAVWVRNCLERSTLQPRTTPYQLLTGKKPDSLQARVVTMSDVVFYENMSLEVWKSEHGLASGRTPTIPPTDTLSVTLPLLAEVGEPAAEDVKDVPSPFPSPAPHALPLVADLCGLTLLIGEQAAAKPTKKQSATRQSVEEFTTEEKSAGKPAEVQQDDEGSEAGDDGGDVEECTDSDMVEVQRGPRQSGRIRRPPDFYVPAAFTTAYDEVDDDLLYDDAEEDEDLGNGSGVLDPPSLGQCKRLGRMYG
ncbi:unnamed protein product [Closterium sp. NIES-53]